MAFPFIVNFCVFVVSHLLLILHSAAYKHQHNCPESFDCGTLGQVKFPFSNSTYKGCGLYALQCSELFPKFNLGIGQPSYEVVKFLNDETVKLKGLDTLTGFKSCDIFSDSIVPGISSVSFTIMPPKLTLFRCNTTTPQLLQQADHYFGGNHRSYGDCSGFTVFYEYPPPPQYHRVPMPGTGSIPPNCVSIQVPVSYSPRNDKASNDIFSLIPDEFSVKWHVSSDCLECRHNGGQCPSPFYGFKHRFNPIKFRCITQEVAGRRNLKWILATVIPGGLILLCMLILTIWRHKKGIQGSLYSRNTSSDPSSKADLEGGGIFFGVPVYSYIELEEATNSFDPSKELGDGGFGTVYHGKLRDGREVAVKRLYEHNYKRVTQFINEIEILTRLRHRNLVSLYGCTSRHCRELLLVYEYIPNGTVADHLHGDRARDGSLTWAIRMNIAIETASALAYLHASDIIHRDVKTNNILLDNNFSVKVADFGLSRLFPNDVTHVSTAPQGTPGYVDPEYHQCYQLTNKSDVYSFGVVLIELISSMPAVDISRHRHEINLANLAMNRIQHRAFSDLIDPSFGFESDSSIEKMTTSVAEVAFRCLQLEKEMRPTMNEVLKALKEIQEYNDEITAEVNTEDIDVPTSKQPPPSPEGDHVGLLLKDREVLTSPESVTNIWNSGSTTTSISSG